MIVRTEGSFQAHDGTELFYQTWTAAQARGTLVVTHGMAEHSEAYDRCFARGMNLKGWNVISWDLRGHGRSQGKRGHVDSFKLFSEDLHSFVQFLNRQGKLSQPFAQVGHSMGGLIALRYLIDYGDEGASALALSSPLLGVNVPVPPIKDLAARVLNRLVPSLTMGNELLYENLSRDPDMLTLYEKDPLRHDKISPALYLGMLESIAYVKTKGQEVKLPAICQVAGHDLIVNRHEAESFFSTVGSKEKRFMIYEHSYHEIYNDLDRDNVFSDLDSFLKKVMGLT